MDMVDRIQWVTYPTKVELPSIMFQVLQEIESEGYVTREIYVDTHSVNLSKAAEEIAAMFRVRIIPVSAGTPQEMAYAESAVRVIGQMGRTLMCGAPHLPGFCWGLADLYATYIHDLLPKDKGMSPFERRTGRKPDLDVFHVKVFGAPCQYAPIDGAEHKRGKKTEWGWFVGMQMPMCLVLRPEDDKIISVSRKKLVVHEECYAKFDFSKGNLPLQNFEIPILDLNAIKNGTTKLGEHTGIQREDENPRSCPFDQIFIRLSPSPGTKRAHSTQPPTPSYARRPII